LIFVTCVDVNIKSFLPCRNDLYFLEVLSQTQFTLRDYGYRASALCCVPDYVTAFDGTHSVYPQRDGQAELTYPSSSVLQADCFNWQCNSKSVLYLLRVCFYRAVQRPAGLPLHLILLWAED